MKNIASIIKNYHKESIGIKQIKLKQIHKEIIELKQENRNLSAKRKGMLESVEYWIKRKGENFDDTRLRNCMEARIRDLNYIHFLTLEKIWDNSKLINKHRAKQRELRSELQELKKSLDNLYGGAL